MALARESINFNLVYVSANLITGDFQEVIMSTLALE
jgi:hypothetical protein